MELAYKELAYKELAYSIDISHNVISYGKITHNIIEDYIDIDIEKSHRIFYCDKCFMTFASSKVNPDNICAQRIKQPNHQQHSDYH